MSEAQAGFVAIALLGKPRGNRGELTAVSLSDNPERFERLERVFLANGASPPHPYSIEEIWSHKGALVFKFAGVDSISGADSLKGSEVLVPAAERAPLEPGAFYHSDLIGCHVIDRRSGREIGAVAALQDAGGSGLLELDTGALIPFARSLCPVIDIERRTIEADLPEGLLELNRLEVPPE